MIIVGAKQCNGDSPAKRLQLRPLLHRPNLAFAGKRPGRYMPGRSRSILDKRHKDSLLRPYNTRVRQTLLEKFVNLPVPL